jgi:hypothetical protein
MASQKIQVYEGNTLSVTCTVTGLDDLVGYDSYFTVKKADGTAVFEKSGSAVGLVLTFAILNTDNAIDAGFYEYEITIDDGTNFFTITKDIYEVLKSLKY